MQKGVIDLNLLYLKTHSKIKFKKPGWRVIGAGLGAPVYKNHRARGPPAFFD